ncbi:hypothetical protein KKG36_00715 [Patescibacteria group bacterium]|nr:hypothetical protein [Patescibacteria group bacterium]
MYPSESDRKIRRWGLGLDDQEAIALLESLLRTCESEDELRREIVFIFGGPMILVGWEENAKWVSITFQTGRNISASA